MDGKITKSKKMKVEAERGTKTLEELLAAVRNDESLKKMDIEKLANKLLEIGRLRIQCENDMKMDLDSDVLESDKVREGVVALKEIQFRHRALEIVFCEKRAELNKNYSNACYFLPDKGRNAFLVSEIKTIQGLAEEITEADEEALKYLSNIKCTTDNSDEFKLEFLFDSNPYFKDSVLTKTFHKPKSDKAMGMEIEWHPGKSLITENGRSFFNFFKVRPVADTTQMEQDYNIGSTIQEKITSASQEGRFFHPVCYRIQKYRDLQRDFSKQRVQLEAKYLNLCRPLYREIRHCEWSKQYKGVPHFWLNAMKNNKVVARQITKRDERALKYLKDIKWKRASTWGFELNFIFRKNPYFKNSVLTKLYQKPIYKETSASEIKWYNGKCLTHDFIKKSVRKSMIRTRESFFHFFNPPLPPHPTKEEIYLHGQAIVKTFKGQIKYDYHIGKIIKDKIIPHAVSWYTGVALQVGSVFHDSGDYDDGYSDISDDEDEEEEEEEE